MLLIFLGFIVLLTVFPAVQGIPCPTNCTCETATFSCQVCLEYYLQVYSLETKGCLCLPGFQLTPQVVDYCHPTNCKQANDWGCATCYPKAEIYYDDTYQYYNCSCRTNYHLNLTNNLCQCLSKMEPSQYYEDTFLDACLACPNGCTCDSSGCASCTNSTLRLVKINQYSSTCYCKKPHFQVNGTCQCAINCTCDSDGTTTCDSNSNRQLIVDQWVCKSPYVQINGECVCQTPYTIVTTLGYAQCVCMSKVNYTSYYEINGSCFECGLNCTCDYTGCVSCFDGSVYVQYETCICSKNYIYQAPNCLCLDPFQTYQNSDGTVSCICLSNRLDGYYTNGDFCAKCPSGCSCNSSGCFSCSDPLRIYTETNSFTVCGCADNSEELEGTCLCNPLFVYDSSSKSCGCKNASGITFYDIDTKICHLCPIGCSCDLTGCNSCIDTAFRTVQLNTQSINTCFCTSPFVEIDGVCSCPFGYVLIDGNCSCDDPYYLDQNNICSCKDQIDNSTYYYDDFELRCDYCPPGCVCNISGCIDCGSDFLRTIKYSLITLRYRCPCLQNSFLVGNYCTVCNNNSYAEYMGNVTNVSCVKCIQCTTCNRYGCLSCPDNMTLVNRSCICNNDTLINQDGVCTCPYLQYLTNNTCQPCPDHCNSCVQINNTVTCTSCGLTVNRQNLPAQGCPCQNQYKQSSTPSTYCCSVTCEDCNDAGCSSCPEYTYRSLVNESCICTDGFVEQNDSLICLCPEGHYLLNNLCFVCPIECLTCTYDSSTLIIICLSCRENVNRNTNDSECTCLLGYNETANFKSEYCYATNCVTEEQNCTQCTFPWVIDEVQGDCNCQKGYWVQSETGCYPCSIDGCLNCLSQLVCVECDESNNYYLVQTFCSEVNTFDFLAVRSIERHLILQFPLKNNTLPYLQEIAVTLNPIMSANPTVLEEEIQLKVITKKLLNNGTLISLLLENIDKTYYKIIVSSVVEVGNNFSSSSLDTTDEVSNNYTTYKMNIKMPVVYATTTFRGLQVTQRIGLYVLVVMTIIVSFGFYVFGFKHNQACFFMQTMSLAGFAIHDRTLSTVIFLYNLRYSYYNFSPYNALSAIVPDDYIEYSRGNFKYITVDANIIRNIGIPLILALVVVGFSIFFRVFYAFTRNKTIIRPAGLAIFWKKMVYRTIQFFYKTLMFPLIFFSIQNLFNWNTNVYIHTQFRRHSSIVSIVIISMYFLVTLYQYFIQLISRLNKYENLKQFLNTVFGSLIIIGSQKHPKVLYVLIIIFVVHELPFFRYKLQDLFVFRIINIIRFTIVILEIICVVLLNYATRVPLIVLICITLMVQMGLMVYKALVDRHYNMVSKLTSYALNEEVDDGTNAQSDEFVLKASEI